MIHLYCKYIVFVLFVHVKPKIFDEVCGQTDVGTLAPVENVPKLGRCSDFQIIREFGYLYVDKTSFAHKIIENPSEVYFLSRPRMFGKSLFLSTLQYILKGRKDLFDGLFIYDKYDWASKYSVIRLDFARLMTDDIKTMQTDFVNNFQFIAKNQFGTDLEDWCINGEKKFVCTCFESLIRTVVQMRPGKRWCLLIDEYDQPIIRHWNNITKAREMQTVLLHFFDCLKSLINEHNSTSFLVYITGVTKFSTANLFSGLNNIKDISHLEEFNNICGFTHQEFSNTDMIGLLQTSIRKTKGANHNITAEDVNELQNTMTVFYDGYRFAPHGQALFSPSATVNYFLANSHQEFRERTPHVKFLFNILLKYKRIDFPVNGCNISFESMGMITDLDELKIERILLDTGVFTIKRYDDYTNTLFLHFPNEKVKEFTFINLLPSLSKSDALPKDFSADMEGLVRHLSILNRENANEFFEKLHQCFSKYVYFGDQPKRRSNSKISENDYIARLETFYEFHFYVFLVLGSMKTPCEIERQRSIESGRTDLTISFPNQKIVIFELKLNLRPNIDIAKARESVVQATKYVQSHCAKNVVITCIGLVFNYRTKNTENWIGITYNAEGKKKELFSKGDLIKEESIGADLDDLKFSDATLWTKLENIIPTTNTHPQLPGREGIDDEAH